MYNKFGQFIDGKWQTSSNNETYDVINPATEEVIGKASKASREDVQKALKSAEKRFKNLARYFSLAKILYYQKNCRQNEGETRCFS